MSALSLFGKFNSYNICTWHMLIFFEWSLWYLGIELLLKNEHCFHRVDPTCVRVVSV